MKQLQNRSRVHERTGKQLRLAVALLALMLVPPAAAAQAETEIDQPISWLRLERHRLGELSQTESLAIEEHLAHCPACKSCYAETGLERELPPLPVLSDVAKTPSASGRCPRGPRRETATIARGPGRTSPRPINMPRICRSSPIGSRRACFWEPGSATAIAGEPRSIDNGSRIWPN